MSVWPLELASLWPSAEEWARVLTLRDHNTRVVLLGTLLLGTAAGVVGTFTLLRKRALMGDALSHATLPGIGLAFVIYSALGGTGGKSLPVLLLGAIVTGSLGLATVLVLRRMTRLKEDAALGIVLSVFFGAGICMLTIVQQLGDGSAAGLEGFIYGKTASMVPSDVRLIAIVGGAAIAGCVLLFKEFRLLCFDSAYAASQGWPTVLLDVLLMIFVTAVTVVGLQAVGLILVIALLIIPAAAARFWSDSMVTMAVLAGVLGGISCAVGSAASALAPKLPSGATIVLIAAFVFAWSMAVGPARGVIPRLFRHWQLSRRIERQHVLRAIYEANEHADSPTAPVSRSALLPMRAWSIKRLDRAIAHAESHGWVVRHVDQIRLTGLGLSEAQRVVRNHRLWEAYLIEFADVAPSHVDRDADAIEHVLDPHIIERLERLLEDAHPRLPAASPHPLPTTATLPTIA